MGEIEPVDDREIAGGDGGAGIAARALLDDAPAGVAVTRGPRHLVAYANACFRRLAGGAGGAGRPFAAAFPALAAGGVAARLDAVYAGEPDDSAARPVRVAGAGAGETFLDIAVRPARDDAGRVDGCVVHATDATDRVLAVRAAGRIVRFQAVAAALAEAATPGEVAAAVVREGLAALGARGGGVVRLREDGGALEALHMVGYPPETIAAWRHYPLDIPSPGREAVETRAPVWVASPADLAARYPNLGRAAPAAGDRSWASLPLVVEGRVLGVLALGFAVEGAVPEADRAYALALARLCAQALERARLLAAERAARAAAEDARAWLDAVIRQLPVGVVVAEAPSGRLLLGNEQVARIWRQPSMSAEDERGYARYQGFHPDGRPYQPEEWPLARALAAGEVVAGERIAFARGDGTRGTLAVSAAPIRDDAGAIVAGVAAFHDVTAQVADEEALRASEEQYRALTEVSPQVVWVGRADGYIIHSNQYWFDYSGLTPAQASGAGWMAAIAPEHRERATAAWLRALREGGDYEIEIPLRRADGRYRWFLARGRPLRDAAGRIVRWVGVAIDIHERRQAEEERARLYDAERAARATAEEDRRRAALLAETSRIFATTAPEPRAILAAMARQVVAGIGDVCAISLLAADGRTLEPAVTDARDPQLRRFVADLLATWPVRLGEGLTGRVARSGEPVLLPRLDPPALRAVAMPEHRAPLARARPRSLLGVPLRVQGRVIGVLALARHTGDRPYTADDLALAQDLADRAALVLERARLAVTGRASRRRAEALAERLTLAQAAARIGTFAWDPESGAVAWTPELETLYGLPPGGFGGHLDAWARSVHPDDRARAVAAARAAVAAGGDLNTQFRIRRPDGAVRHLL
ncbi:MAG TPA: PAS domain-containing protein, partial [Thermomicrobiales bacterium]|nr:PAS domain-containing protein [Thermomicrobiales bacterium]